MVGETARMECILHLGGVVVVVVVVAIMLRHCWLMEAF
jgi:hypothetical protein